MKNTKRGIIFYRVFSRAYFHLPFLTVFFYKKGFDILQISCILAFYSGSALLSSILIKKNVKDNISSKHIILLSEVLKLIGLFMLIYFNNLVAFLFAQMLLGLSYSIGAGVDSEIIYNEIDDNVTEFQSKSNSYMFNTLLISGLIGSWLFNKNIELPFVATFLCTLVGIIGFSLNIENRKLDKSNLLMNNRKKKNPLACECYSPPLSKGEGVSCVWVLALPENR